MISKSPDRHTFQADAYVKRCEAEGKEVQEEYLELFKSARQRDEEKIADPEWSKDNLEYDLRTTDWILEKVRASKLYAQNLYAAICNNDFQKLDVIPLLKDQLWHCSWRYAGGIIAHMRQEGDYIDWYCSGYDDSDGIAQESFVTDEVREDLLKLGWLVREDNGTSI